MSTYIIGSGLAGLSAAIHLEKSKEEIIIYEAAKIAGGRCRSFLDEKIEKEINNGNHLIIGANHEALSFIRKIEAEDKIKSAEDFVYSFLCLRSGKYLEVSSLQSPVTSAIDYLKILKLSFAGKNKTVANYFNSEESFFDQLIRLLSTSILNTPPEKASAKILKKVFKKIMRTKNGLTPYLPKKSWQESLINPALSRIEKNGGAINFGHRLKKIDFMDNRISTLHIGEEKISIGKNDNVILALPPQNLKTLLPEIIIPEESNPIVNVHYAFEHKQEKLMLGLISANAEWLFFNKGIISTTTSAANELVKEDENIIAEKIWADVVKALKLDNETIPPYRVIKEKQATFSCTPQNLKRRPKTKTQYDNLFLAGDFIDTGLPATIESAIKSGRMAAECCL